MPPITLEEMVHFVDLARKQPDVPPTPPNRIPIEDILIEILKRIQALEK